MGEAADFSEDDGGVRLRIGALEYRKV